MLTHCMHIGVGTMGARGAIAPPPNNFFAAEVKRVLSYIHILVAKVSPPQSRKCSYAPDAYAAPPSLPPSHLLSCVYTPARTAESYVHA